MNIKVYDFDKTIYDGDSTIDFYFYCLKKNKRILKYIFVQLWAFALYVLGIIDKTKFKEKFYVFLRGIENIDYTLKGFWDTNSCKIKKFYMKQKHDSDVIISASPEFLLEPICKKLKVKKLIASRVDKKTGLYTGINCYGAEKVERLNQEINDYNMDEFYSDSFSDEPLANLARYSYIVDGEEIVKWNEYKIPLIKKLKMQFLSIEFLAFLVIGVINTFNGILFSWLFSLKLDANIAFVIGYICSLTIAYLLNTFMIFKEKLGISKYIKFCISYIPNFIIQNVVVIVVFNILGINKLVAFALAAIIGIPITFLCVKLFTFTKKTNTENGKSNNIISILKSISLFIILFCTLMFIIPSILFIFKVTISKLTIFIVLTLAITLFILIEKKLNKNTKIFYLITIMVVSILLITICIAFSSFIIDTSDDGLSYHKTAILYLKNGWNPMYEDCSTFYSKHSNILEGFSENSALWVDHYAKGSWIYSATLYSLTNNIESGKSINLLILIVVLIESYVLFSKKSKTIGIVIAAIISFCPTICFQMFSYYIDGLLAMYFFLVLIYLINIMCNKGEKNIRSRILLFLTVVMCINIKFTGLIFAGVPCIVFYIFFIIRSRKDEKFKSYFIKETIFFVLMALFSILLVGSNTYIKNTIDHSNPLYPLVGEDKVDIITSMQPAEFENVSGIQKFVKSLFSPVDNFVASSQKNVETKIPFTISDGEKWHLKATDIRLSGFGVFFSGLFIISIIIILIYFVIVIIKKRLTKENSIILMVLGIVILTSLLAGEIWWARYAPQIYLILITAMYIIMFSKEISTFTISNILSLILVILIGINSWYALKPRIDQINRSKDDIKIIIKLKQADKKVNAYTVRNIDTILLMLLRDFNIEYDYKGKIGNNKIDYDYNIANGVYIKLE